MIDRSFKISEAGGNKSTKEITKTLALPKETELRIKVEFDDNIYVKVKTLIISAGPRNSRNKRSRDDIVLLVQATTSVQHIDLHVGELHPPAGILERQPQLLSAHLERGGRELQLFLSERVRKHR